ncbi:hypothetical protein J437_LFUL016460 [Ladona fulva]|uniref:Uncharacterized protein n=1 Tax=Ladona fulva TaxID=123851 RepID=A0A8K0P974_LADFU|nr:hypothetical protein J437_LFUL016460 [Ladona fulva]
MLLRQVLHLNKPYFSVSRFRHENRFSTNDVKKNVDCSKFTGLYPNYLDFSKQFDASSREEFSRDMRVLDNFVTEDEETSLVEELSPVLNELHYEFDHWDDAIHGFRETERLKWNDDNMKIINRVRRIAFPPNSGHLYLVHVLDLAKDGHIKPHIDSIRVIDCVF